MAVLTIAAPNRTAIPLRFSPIGINVEKTDDDAANGEQEPEVVHRVRKFREGKLDVPFLPYAVTDKPIATHHEQWKHKAEPEGLIE